MSWWQDEARLERFVCDLVADEAARLKPRLRLPVRPWPHTLDMGEDGLGLDSLDRLGVAARLAGRLQLGEARAFDRFLAAPTLGDWIDGARAALLRDDGALGFASSGSMGEPKLAVHRLAALVDEVTEFARILAPVQRVVTLVPSHHIYGFLFTLLLPEQTGAGVIDLRASSSAALAGLAAGDVVVGYPLVWQAAAEAGVTFPAGITGVNSTGPLAADVIAQLKARGLARLVEVYGSTETAGVGWRDDCAQPFRLLDHWRRVADDEIEREVEGRALRVRLPDEVAWVDERHLLPRGRRDGRVKVGGVAVSLARVEQVLTAHPAVAAAIVRLMSPAEGQRLKAFVVSRAGAGGEDEIARALDAHVRDRLTAPERPVSFTFGEELPRSTMGKPVDWPLT